MSLSERSQSSEANESEESVKACLEDMIVAWVAGMKDCRECGRRAGP